MRSKITLISNLSLSLPDCCSVPCLKEQRCCVTRIMTCYRLHASAFSALLRFGPLTAILSRARGDNQEGGRLTGTNFFAGYLVKPPLGFRKRGLQRICRAAFSLSGLGGPVLGFLSAFKLQNHLLGLASKFNCSFGPSANVWC
jgi:hypothetical protein